jgi:ornithine cyclodeaminase/alanine dehydrogenase-like protein (mu-crystallin family)
MLTGMRTAASNAVAVDALARRDASNLTVFGAGGQALFEVKAVCQVTPLPFPSSFENPIHPKPD